MRKKLLKLTAIILCVTIIQNIVVTKIYSATKFEKAKKAISKITVGWNLGNTLDTRGDYIDKSSTKNFETAWGNPVTTPQMTKYVKEAGFNAVRVPVTYYGRFDDEGNINKAWLDRVEEVVNYVLDEDMYCIINLHHDTGTEGWLRASKKDYAQMSKLYKKLWSQIAKRFNKYGEKLIFESFNEILDINNEWGQTDDTSYEVVNKLNQLFVNTVRKSGSNNRQRNLILNTYGAKGDDYTLSKFTLPKDTSKNRLIVEIHNYDPMSFTFKDVTWTTMTEKWNGSKEEKYDIDNICDVLNKYSKKLGVPIIIGEAGCVDKNNETERARYMGYFVQQANKKGIKLFYWDDGGDFKLLDRRALKFTAPKVINAMIKSSK